VDAIDTEGLNLPIRAFGSGATTKIVGAVGKDAAGRTVCDAITLSGTTAVNGKQPFRTVNKLLYGDLESNRTATFEVGNLTWDTASATLTTIGADEPPDGARMAVTSRYLHWCLANDTTAASGGAKDRLLVKLYG
jgi:hypothetical protein